MRRSAICCGVILGALALAGCQSARAPGVFNAGSVAPPPSLAATKQKATASSPATPRTGASRRSLTVPQ